MCNLVRGELASICQVYTCTPRSFYFRISHKGRREAATSKAETGHTTETWPEEANWARPIKETREADCIPSFDRSEIFASNAEYRKFQMSFLCLNNERRGDEREKASERERERERELEFELENFIFQGL